jgi:hypothetical protein
MPYLNRIYAVFMPYELIRHTLGIDSGYKLLIFGIDHNCSGIFREYLKNYPGIADCLCGYFKFVIQAS